MPSIAENLASWSARDWSDGGEGWSRAWGGSRSQWYGSILPRIERHLPTGTILEIGCGFGRWSRFLRRECEALVLVDLTPACVAACEALYRTDSRVQCLVTDGYTLPGVAEETVDFAFSFDSLVHAEMDVLRGYLQELRRTLTPGGAAFLHHSNFADVRSARIEAANPHWRAESVSARLVDEAARAVGLGCAVQEIITWGDVVACDAFSLITRRPGTAVLRVDNPGFMDEARLAASRAGTYGAVQTGVMPADRNGR